MGLNARVMVLVGAVVVVVLVIAGAATFWWLNATGRHQSGSKPSSLPVLTQEQASSALLDSSDVGTAYVEDTSSDTSAEPTCLDALDRIGSPAAQVTRALTDGFSTAVVSSISSYPTMQDSVDSMSQARRITSECKQVQLSGQTLSVSTARGGPIHGSDDQLMIVLASRDSSSDGLAATIVYDRVENNVGSTAVLSSGPPNLDFAALSQRLHDKFVAVSDGKPAPPAPAPSAAGAKQLTFGQTYQGDRSKVTVSKPVVFQPSDSAAADPGRHVKLSIKVENLGSDVMSSADFSDSATCGERQAPTVIDPDKGIDGFPPGDILPGRTITWDVAYTVQPRQCELVVSLTFGTDTLYFLGNV